MLTNHTHTATEHRHSILRVLAAVDTFLWISALVLAFPLRFNHLLWYYYLPADAVTFSHYSLPIACFGLLFLIIAPLSGLYTGISLFKLRNLFLPLLRTYGLWLLGVFCCLGVLNVQPEISRGYLLVASLLGLSFLGLWRCLVFLYCKRTRHQLQMRAAYWGWDEGVATLAQSFHQSPAYISLGLFLSKQGEPVNMPRLGGKAQLTALLQSHSIDVLVISNSTPAPLAAELHALASRYYVHVGQPLTFATSGFQTFQADTVEGSVFLRTGNHPLHRVWNRSLKRAVDIVGACVGLTLSAPLILLLGVLILREGAGSIFYRQTRVGYLGKTFSMWKLRSMRANAEQGSAGWSVAEDPRRTTIGGFMRKWNLDEIPQFWNVLRGDMSLVGPRPERPEFTKGFEAEFSGYNPRHSVRPGMSGWAQVQGLRGDTDIGERLQCDIYYVEHWSLWLDIQIMILTFFRRDNAY
jgi:exopolysaccharide biosynthesis polyprenyl glycosylphosphotransferase